MNIQEFRIGNLVDTINRSGEVHLPRNEAAKIGEIGFFHVKLYNSEMHFSLQKVSKDTDISDLSPISLTEKWLLKFGFEPILNINFILKIDEFNTFQLLLRIDREKPNDDVFIYMLHEDMQPKVIKYVHQLQNLYHSLTGKELELLNK